MGRHAKKRKDPEAVPDPLEPEAPEVEAAENDDQPKVKKKVGRPPKAKVDVELPPEVRQLIAVFPLILAGAATERAIGIQLQYSPEALAGCVSAFETWLSSYEVKMTPGWALIAAYCVAIGGAASAAQPRPPKPAPSSPPKEKEVRPSEGPTVTPNGAPNDAPHADPNGPGSTATPA